MLEAVLNRLRPLYRNTRWAHWPYRRLKGQAPCEEMFTLREALAGRYLGGSGIGIGGLHNPLRVPEGGACGTSTGTTCPAFVPTTQNWRTCRWCRWTWSRWGTTPVLRPRVGRFRHRQPLPRTHPEPHRRSGSVSRRSPGRRGSLLVRHGQGEYVRPGPAADQLRSPTQGLHRRRRVVVTGPPPGVARLVEKVPEAEVPGRVRQLAEMAFSIHYHVWTHDSLSEFLIDGRRRRGLPFGLEALMKNGAAGVSICMLRLRGAAPA